MPHNPNSSPFSERPKRVRVPPSVMFTVTYEDSRSAYLVIEGHGGPEEDFRALALARERQQTGELPEGAIRTVKRVR